MKVHHKHNSILILAMLLFCLSCQNEKPSQEIPGKPISTDILLEKVPAEISGILFSNTIKENERLHAFIWNFIYQGSGVAIGDINNDGLQDIYFGGNMKSDKLYLNKGNFQFEDISESSGIQDRLWTTGITMVDINADGLLDIYVCKNFFLLQEGVRKNKLFINNGNLTFTEQAEKYGIADAGYSIQSHFFDFENDGDLDLYLINQPMDQYASLLAKPETLLRLPFSDKLYLNSNDHFTDVTNKLNLQNKSYGLSAMCTDFDGDGWIDIYLCNDYDAGDNFLMNNNGLGFKDEISQRIDHCSYNSMGSDVADINNDGLLDFITLDMAFSSHYRSKTNMKSMQPDKFKALLEAGNHYQYPSNNLHINHGNGQFSEIAHYLKVSNTDWSWSPLFVDLNNDSNKDLIISNGLLRDLRNNDFATRHQIGGKMNIDKNNYKSILSEIPSTPVANYVFQNHGELNFSDVSTASGFDYNGFSTGMAYGDLDNDGDMDLVINNTNAIASIYKNESPRNNNYVNVKLEGPSKNNAGIGSTVTLYYNNTRQVSSIVNARGYMSSSQMIASFGIGHSKAIDSIVVRWNNKEQTMISKPKINGTVIIKYSEAKEIKEFEAQKTIFDIKEHNLLSFKHVENVFNEYQEQILLPHSISQNGPFLCKGDVDNNGLVDIFIGGASGQSGSLYLQNSEGQFSLSSQKVFHFDKNKEDLGSVFFDLENDGDLDLYVVSGGSQFNSSSELNVDRIYINDGKGNFSNYRNSLHETNIDGQCVIAEDFNGDHFIDIFIGGRSLPGKYPAPANSKLLINKNGVLEDKTDSLAPSLRELGLVTSAIAGDYDNDGDKDIIVVGEWLPPTLFLNSDGQFTKKILIENQNLTGWLWTINQGDFDNDGDLDFLIANLGLNNKFNASSDHTFQVYSGDLDKNGDHDIVLAKLVDNELFPVRGKECSTQELPFLSTKYTTYDAFARANLQDIYSPETLDASWHYVIENFAHLYIENRGNNTFQSKQLPYQTQLGAIKDFVVLDINEDGFLDFIYAGNHYPTEVETVRYDANRGGICLGDGQGRFQHLNPKQSGINLNKDVRDLEILKLGNQETFLLATVNNGTLISKKLNK